MRTTKLFGIVLAGLLAALLQIEPADALNVKSWVSHTGSDASPCTVAQPCATFQRAHDQTSPGGEIGVFTPGDYGPSLIIARSISITADGAGEASIVPLASTNGIGIDVDAGGVV